MCEGRVWWRAAAEARWICASCHPPAHPSLAVETVTAPRRAKRWMRQPEPRLRITHGKARKRVDPDEEMPAWWHDEERVRR